MSVLGFMALFFFGLTAFASVSNLLEGGAGHVHCIRAQAAVEPRTVEVEVHAAMPEELERQVQRDAEQYARLAERAARLAEQQARFAFELHTF